MQKCHGAGRVLYTLLHCAAFALVSHACIAAPPPELFAQGTVSTRDDEFGIAFAPDGQTAYFTKRSPTTNTPPLSAICVTHLINGRWSEPEIAPFSGRYNDFGVSVSADGKRIVFSSDRPADGSAEGKAANIDLWVIDRQGDTWSDARNLGAPVNTPAAEAYPSLAGDGTLYFASSRPGGKGGPDIYRSRWVDGKYSEPEDLSVNGPSYDSQPAIAPDQSFLVFTSSGRADTLAEAGAPYAHSDLYISFRNGNDWSAPRNLGAPINTGANESSPNVSPDGLWLYFASDRSFVSIPMPRRLSAREYEAALHGVLNGWNNIYRVPIAAIEGMRANGQGTQQP